MTDYALAMLAVGLFIGLIAGLAVARLLMWLGELGVDPLDIHFGP